MQYVLKHQRGLLFSLLLVAFTAVFTSCGKDEPSSTVIDYYLDIEEEFLINGSTSLTDRYYSPITRMRDAIRKTYPTTDNKGKDEAVVAACDKEYEEYYQMYIGEGHHFTSFFHLVRVIKTNGIVKQSETLRTFVYDINPVETDVEE